MSVKFVIVGAPRTGSTLLVKTLNSQDSVCCHGELLQVNVVRGYEDGFDPFSMSAQERDERAERLLRERNDDPVGFIRQALERDTKAVGFKVLYEIFLHPDWRGVLDSLTAPAGTRFIHLKRRNSLRRYISEQVMLAGGPIHSAAGGRGDQQRKIHIDIDDFLRQASQIAAEAREVEDILSGMAVLDVYYEELAAATGATVSAACQFLGIDVDPSHIQPALQKVGAADLSDSVDNYRELLDHEATRALALSD